MNEPIPKKSHLRRNIAIAAIIVLLLLIIGFIAYNFYYSPRLHTFTENDAINMPPSSYKYIKINVPSGATNISLRIYLTAQGELLENGIRCYIMDQTNFENWKNGHQAYFIYNSGLVVVESVEKRLPGPGVYYVVFDNTFSASSKIVKYLIELRYYA